MRRTRGVSLVEALVAVLLVSTAFMTLLGVFSLSVRQAASSRERILATVLVHSLIEEVRAHHFGSPAPRSWTNRTEKIQSWVNGRPSFTEFKESIKCDNGAFVGVSQQRESKASMGDLVTVSVAWTEFGANGSSMPQHLNASIHVWRQDDTARSF